MVHLPKDYYSDLAQQIVTELYDNSQNDGVIEMQVKCSGNRIVDTLFAFSVTDFSLSGGLESMNYLIIAFQGGVRCSTDFEPSKLSVLIDT